MIDFMILIMVILILFNLWWSMKENNKLIAINSYTYQYDIKLEKFTRHFSSWGQLISIEALRYHLHSIGDILAVIDHLLNAFFTFTVRHFHRREVRFNIRRPQYIFFSIVFFPMTLRKYYNLETPTSIFAMIK